MEENSKPTEQNAENKPTVDFEAEVKRLTEENEKLRKANTSASAEASKFKKELASRMSEDERKSAEAAEVTAKMQQELDALRREKTVSDHKANFLGIGYDDALAAASAEALADGNMSAVFESFKKFIAAHDKEISADMIRKTPKPGTGSVEGSITKEQFDKMGYSELKKLYEENKPLYDELSKK